MLRGMLSPYMYGPFFEMPSIMVGPNCDYCMHSEEGSICYLKRKICDGGNNEMADLRKTFKKGTSVKLNQKFFDDGGGVRDYLVQGKTYKISKHYGSSEAYLLDPETGKEVSCGSIRFTYLELASREEQAKSLLEEASELQGKVNQMKVKAERLMKYKSDDEEAAAIISDIVKSNGDQAKILEIIRSSGVEINLVK